MFEDFYGTFATVSLTVTGLWMFVAQARFREWLADRDHFRRASALSVQLAFPGLMCMFALIDPVSKLLWRVSFGLTSAIAVCLVLTLHWRSAGRWATANMLGNLTGALLFACIGVVAVLPEVVADPGIRMAPRRVEFVLFTLLLLDGIVVAWIMLFAEISSSPTRPRLFRRSPSVPGATTSPSGEEVTTPLAGVPTVPALTS